MRILVTGSRDWRDRDVVWTALREAAEDRGVPFRDVIVVHGDCPTGADRDALRWALSRGAKDEPHPANWQRDGRRAGPVRNRKMVNLGADICLAFIRPCVKEKCPTIALHGSHGSMDTVLNCYRSRIPVVMYREGW